MTTDRHIPITRLDPAVERLLNRDRVKEARMLPTGKLKAEHHQQVRDLLDELTLDGAGERTVTFAQIARAVGKSPSVISQWHNGSYPSKLDPITRAVNQFIETSLQRQQTIGDQQFIETWLALQMVARVRMAHHAGKMLCLIAPAGSGKSMVIDFLADEFAGFKVYCDGALRPKAFLQRVAAVCKTRGTGTIAEILDALVARLKGRQTVLFIDEAHLLTGPCAGIIRSLYDQTGVTIAMFGAKQIFDLIDDRASGGGQFWRRCQKVNMLKQAGLARNDDGQPGRPLFSVDEIRQVVEARGLRLADADALHMLAQMANVPDSGALDLVCSLVANVVYLYGEDTLISVAALTNALMMSDDVNGEALLREVDLDQDTPLQRTA